jgi:glutaredoxin 3
MAEVIIYTKEICPYCVKAKGLLQRKNIQFTEIKVTDDKTKEEMVQKSGGRMTVPQIFINGNAIGGCDDLHALDAEGQLDEMLK